MPKMTSGLASLLSIPWLRVLACSTGLFLLCSVYGATHFFRDPGSIFFDPSRAYDRFYSSIREVEAKRSMDVYMAGSNLFPAPDPQIKPSICASFLTVARSVEHQYIYTSVGSLLSGISQHERSDIHLKLFFAEIDTARHPSYNESWTKDLIDDAFTYSDAELEDLPQTIGQYPVEEQIHVKGILDYIIALERCFDTSDAPYLAIFEDDILLADGWLARTLVALRQADALVRASNHPDRDWLNLRLFNQERSTGWSSSRVGGNHDFLIALLIDLPLVFALFQLHRNTHRVSNSPRVASTIYCYTEWPCLAVITLVIVPSFVILFFRCGKASLFPPSPGLKIENFGCCSQALVFNRRQIPAYVNFLKSQLDAAPNDVLTAFYALEVPLFSLALYPMQAQHIGLTSATGTSKEEASKVWSMAFESLNVQWLHDSHQSALSILYNQNK